jgi:hypothetical protein
VLYVLVEEGKKIQLIKQILPVQKPKENFGNGFNNRAY